MIRRWIAAILISLAAALPAVQTSAQTPTPRPGADLAACWNMDEWSGLRADLAGSSHLSDTNTVGSVAGQYLNAAYFVSANSEYLSVAHNPNISLQGTTRYTWAFWLKPDTTALTRPIFKTNEFIIQRQADGTMRLAMESIWTGATGVAPTGQWSLVVFWDDGSNVYLQLNNGTPVYFSRKSYSGTSPLYIGGGYAGQYFDGAIDEVAFWRRSLSTAERTWLYNNGAGHSCSEMVFIQTPPEPDVDFSVFPVTLSSGDQLKINRHISYGDLLVFGMIGVLMIVVIVAVIHQTTERWFP